MNEREEQYQRLITLLNIVSDGLGDDVRHLRRRVEAACMLDALQAGGTDMVLEVEIVPATTLDEWGIPEDANFDHLAVAVGYRRRGEEELSASLSIAMPTNLHEELSPDDETQLAQFLEITYEDIVLRAC